MSTIVHVQAREILDSRGNPTRRGRGHQRTGQHRARRRAVGREHRGARGRRAARRRQAPLPRQGRAQGGRHVNETLAEAVLGFDTREQLAIDQALLDADGTPNKGKLGANAILGVSLAVARAAALDVDLPLYRYLGGPLARVLPVPLMNVINGGAHADNNLDFQETMLVPHGFATFSEALRAGVEVFHALKGILRKQKKVTAVGDEGGFAPDMASNAEALATLLQAIEAAGYKPGEQISLALDVAASEFYDKKPRRPLRAGRRGRALARRRRAGRAVRRAGRQVPAGVDRGRHGPRTTGTAGSRSPSASARACSWSATTCSSPTRAPRTGIERDRQLDPRQGQPDRHAHRDPRGGPARPAQPLPRGDLPPQRRDGRHVHRRPRGRDQRRADQDRLGFALRPRREVQPAPAHRVAARRQRPVRRPELFK
jgi:hypothetical protein